MVHRISIRHLARGELYSTVTDFGSTVKRSCVTYNCGLQEMSGTKKDEHGINQNAVWSRHALRSAVQRYIVTTHNWQSLEDSAIYRVYRKAAVLIPLFLCDGTVHVWLTKRSHNVGSYKGQVSFPGGMKEPDDEDEIATSLREAKEEIGLEAGQVEVLGPLYPRETFPKILVTPVVGIVDEGYKPVSNEEVELTFHLPLNRFLKNEDCLQVPYQHGRFPANILFFYDEVKGKQITTWGLTASICAELAVGIFQKETEYEYAFGNTLLPEDPFVLTRLNLKRLTNEIMMKGFADAVLLVDPDPVTEHHLLDMDEPLLYARVTDCSMK